MTKQILLNAFDMNTPSHQSNGLWRHPRDHSPGGPLLSISNSAKWTLLSSVLMGAVGSV